MIAFVLATLLPLIACAMLWFTTWAEHEVIEPPQASLVGDGSARERAA